jgi:hypothetical protein
VNWEEQAKEVRDALETLFSERPEIFRPVDVECCGNPEHDHEVDAGSYIITGAMLCVQQRNLEGNEIICVFKWPADMGRVQAIGLLEVTKDRFI